VIGRIGEKHGKSAAQVALRFLVQLGVVPIPKSMNPGRIKENFDVFNFELDGEDMERMAELEMGERARVSDFLNIFKG
jgi:diketogulonate reductase-like aldo/keto reductase